MLEEKNITTFVIEFITIILFRCCVSHYFLSTNLAVTKDKLFKGKYTLHVHKQDEVCLSLYKLGVRLG